MTKGQLDDLYRLCFGPRQPGMARLKNPLRRACLPAFTLFWLCCFDCCMSLGIFVGSIRMCFKSFIGHMGRFVLPFPEKGGAVEVFSLVEMMMSLVCAVVLLSPSLPLLLPPP
ncbi:unnamed protein product [Pylaiella littoralis]